MAKKLMAKYECSRCTREWYEEFREGQELPSPPSFKMHMVTPGEPEVLIEYEELCKTCARSVGNYAASIAKQLKNKSPKRAKKKPPEAASSMGQQAAARPPSAPSRTSSAGSTEA